MATISSAPGVSLGRGATRTDINAVLIRLAHRSIAGAIVGLILFLSIHGASYYRLSALDRSASPLYDQLRSSGTIGLKLGFVGVAMFGFLFLYAVRKRIRPLARIGNTRTWLNFHILFGVSAPIVITFHAGFMTNGLAGVAYWTMMVVAASGLVGRYLYAKIPRTRKAVAMSIADLEDQAAAQASALRESTVFRAEDVDRLLAMPTAEEIRRANVAALFWSMLCIDLGRPFRVARLRRQALGGSNRIFTLGGLLASSDQRLEATVAIARRQARLRMSIAFLEGAERVFHAWHVVHRPFSVTFVALIVVHIGVALALGIW